MSTLGDLLRRANRLQDQLELARRELAELRDGLAEFNHENEGTLATQSTASTDCLTLAMTLATELGPDFSSEDAHDLAGRGSDWFAPA